MTTAPAFTREGADASDSYRSICSTVSARGFSPASNRRYQSSVHSSAWRAPRRGSQPSESMALFALSAKCFISTGCGPSALIHDVPRPSAIKSATCATAISPSAPPRAKIQGARCAGRVGNEVLQENQVARERIENMLPWPRRLRISQHNGTTSVFGAPNVRN